MDNNLLLDLSDTLHWDNIEPWAKGRSGAMATASTAFRSKLGPLIFITKKKRMQDLGIEPAAHGQVVREAARRGIDVLCQKPLMPTFAEAEEVAAACAGRIRLVRRFRPAWRAAPAWVAAGKIGRRRLFRLAVEGGRALSAGRRRTPALLGSPAVPRRDRPPDRLGVARPPFDALASVLGALEMRAAALCRLSPAVRGEDSATLTMRTASGATGALTASFHVPGAPVSPADRLLLLGEA